MQIEMIKQKMLKYRDFYGGDLLNVSDIKNAKTKQQIIDQKNPTQSFFHYPDVIELMSAAREDEREQIREIIELRIYEIDGDKLMTAYAHRRRELKQLLKKLK